MVLVTVEEIEVYTSESSSSTTNKLLTLYNIYTFDVQNAYDRLRYFILYYIPSNTKNGSVAWNNNSKHGGQAYVAL